MFGHSSPLIVAHRGDTTRAHENTLEACEHAIATGADMLELDLRRTADGVLVVHHDDCIGALALARAGYDEALAESTRAGFRLARFDELLRSAKGRILLDVELKEEGYEPEVVRHLADAGLRAREFVLTSFDGGILARARAAAAASVQTGLLLDEMTGAEALDAFEAAGVHFLAPDWRLLDDDTLARAAERGIELLPWTVNEGPAVRRLLTAAAVAGIITDRPAEALRIRADASRDRASRRRPPGAVPR